jgi:hypothetical protein
MTYSMSNISRHQIKEFTAYKDKVFVTDLERGDVVTAGGIIVPDDNMRDRGIRPRWGRVWAIGRDVEEVEVGQWILIEHGRWTQKITLDFEAETVEVWSVEYPKSVLMASDEDPRGSVTGLHDRGKEFAVRKFHR